MRANRPTSKTTELLWAPQSQSIAQVIRLKVEQQQQSINLYQCSGEKKRSKNKLTISKVESTGT